MKKLFALFLISVTLLASCTNPAGTGQEIPKETTGETTAEKNETVENSQNYEIEMKPTNGIVVTNKRPEKTPEYSNSEAQPPSDIKYILRYTKGLGHPRDYYESIRSAFTCEKNIEYDILTMYYPDPDKWNSYKAQTMLSGIIDNEEKFRAFYEEFVSTDFQTYTVTYSDLFLDNFFEDNIILFSMSEKEECVFVGFEYGFDPSSKTLKIDFATRPHEGWHGDTAEFVGLVMHLVYIPKSDLTIDGKLVPYEELNIEVTGKLMLD